jgi:hypothetical protein
MRTRALAVSAGLVIALAGCTSDGDGMGSLETGKLTEEQYAAAVNLARHEVEAQDAKLTSATAVVRHNAGRDAPSNTGHRCLGEEVLRIRLIGTFPHVVTTGTPGGHGGPVTELDIKADPEAGVACLIGVGTSSHPTPEKDATELQLDD